MPPAAKTPMAIAIASILRIDPNLAETVYARISRRLGRKFRKGLKSNKPGKKKNTRKYIKPRSNELAMYHRFCK